MKYIITSCLITFSSFFCYSQSDIKREQINPAPQKTVRSSNAKSIESTEVRIENKKEITKPERVVLSSENTVKNYASPIRATRIDENVVKNDINIKTDPKKSDLDNLLSLLEEKENIHKHNSSLVQNSKYNDLLSEIAKYKTSFNKSVTNRGIENCSSKEQNIFLSFLKEEGKEAEYKTAIAKIK